MTGNYSTGQFQVSERVARTGGRILRDRCPFHFLQAGGRKSPVMALYALFSRPLFVKSRRKKRYDRTGTYWFIIAFITRLLTKRGLENSALQFSVNRF